MWLSTSSDLYVDACRDMRDLGANVRVINGCVALDRGTRALGLDRDLQQGVLFMCAPDICTQTMRCCCCCCSFLLFVSVIPADAASILPCFGVAAIGHSLTLVLLLAIVPVAGPTPHWCQEAVAGAVALTR